MTKVIVVATEELQALVIQSVRQVLAESAPRTPQPYEKRFMNVHEAAQFLGRSSSSVYQLASRGMLPYSKRAKRLYFEPSKLEQWLDEGVKLTNEELTQVIDSGHRFTKKNRR